MKAKLLLNLNYLKVFSKFQFKALHNFHKFRFGKVPTNTFRSFSFTKFASQLNNYHKLKYVKPNVSFKLYNAYKTKPTSPIITHYINSIKKIATTTPPLNHYNQLHTKNQLDLQTGEPQHTKITKLIQSHATPDNKLTRLRIPLTFHTTVPQNTTLTESISGEFTYNTKTHIAKLLQIEAAVKALSTVGEWPVQVTAEGIEIWFGDLGKNVVEGLLRELGIDVGVVEEIANVRMNESESFSDSDYESDAYYEPILSESSSSGSDYCWVGA